jgi:hypothetical protein
MRTQKHENHGRHAVSTCGYLDLQRTTIGGTYYVPETRGYSVSAAADLFPQHCIAPSFMPESHVKELSNELQDNLKTMGRKTRTLQVLQDLAIHMEAYITGNLPPQQEQRVEQSVMDEVQQINPPLIQRVIDTPRMPNANNPTSKRVMQMKVRTHKKKTRGNIPGVSPLIIHPNIIKHLAEPTVPSTKQLKIMARHTKRAKAGSVVMPRRSTRIRGLEPSAHIQFHNSRIISQEAINLLLIDDIDKDLTKITPLKFQPSEEQNFDLAKLIFIRVRYVHADPINFIF